MSPAQDGASTDVIPMVSNRAFRSARASTADAATRAYCGRSATSLRLSSSYGRRSLHRSLQRLRAITRSLRAVELQSGPARGGAGVRSARRPPRAWRRSSTMPNTLAVDRAFADADVRTVSKAWSGSIAARPCAGHLRASVGVSRTRSDRDVWIHPGREARSLTNRTS
jgi:hypothetical protein